MPLEISYPCHASGEPAGVSGFIVRSLAFGLRQRVAGAATKPIEMDVLARRASWMRINGRMLRIAWDWEHAVHDPDGDPVLGACEHDPAEPDMVMISLNGAMLEHQPELLRSTAAHELAHAIFDMPAAIGAGRRRVFRNHATASAPDGKRDWREWRADQFMGEFLVPRRQLARALVQEANAHGVALRWRVRQGVASPVLDHSDHQAFDSIIGSLAVRFGVSAAFIAVRCAKNGFIAPIQ